MILHGPFELPRAESMTAALLILMPVLGFHAHSACGDGLLFASLPPDSEWLGLTGRIRLNCVFRTLKDTLYQVRF